MTYEEYIDPSLLVLVPVLYACGIALKNAQLVKDKYIPLIVGALGVVLACMYVIATRGLCVESLFVGIVQGVLCAGASVYANQIIKQLNKVE